MRFPVKKIVPIGSDKDFPTWIPRYFDDKVLGIRSQLTAKAKRSDLQKFLGYYEHVNGHLDADQWLPRDTKGFMDELVRQGYLPSSVNRHLATIRSLGGYLLERGVVPGDPCRAIRELAISAPTPKAIRDLEFHRLRKSADMLVTRRQRKYTQDFRNRILMEFLAASALRVSEALALRLDQLEGKKLKSVRCKGNRYRDVLITASCAESLHEYIKDHRIAGSEFIFTNRYGQKMSRTAAAQAMNLIAGIANATLTESDQIRLTPHRLRHRAGYKARQIKDELWVQKRLGHSSGKYSGIYAGLSDEEESELVEQMD